MPPIKGRMMGLQSGRMSGPPQSSQSTIGSATVTSIGIQRRKPKFSGRGGKITKKAVCQEELKKLRIPSTICKSLPSVKKFANSREFIDITEDQVNMEDESSQEGINVVLGVKKGRGAGNRYHIMAIAEKRFAGMVWDIKFRPHSDSMELLISCGVGVFLCDEELVCLKQLDNIRLAGGIGYLSDGRIVVICRCMDVLNVYSSEGDFVRDFSCGGSPMGLCVTSKDHLLISDCLSKEVRSYNLDGTLIWTVASTGNNYNIRWPLYMDIMPNDSFVLVDCHLQNTLVFDNRGRFVRSIPTRTYGGNEVLRPHGLCLTPSQDLFIIDNAINTLEVFTTSGTYLQTLFPTEEGSKLQPKVVACSNNGYMAMGGLRGHVRLFKFVSDAEAKLDIKREVKDEIMEEKVPPIKIKPRPKGKLEKQRLKQQAEVKVKPEIKIDLDPEPDEVDLSIEAVVMAAHTPPKTSRQQTYPRSQGTSKHQVMEIQDGNEQVTVIVLD